MKMTSHVISVDQSTRSSLVWMLLTQNSSQEWSSFASQDCSCTETGGGMSSRMLYLHGAGGWPKALVLSHLELSMFQLGSHKCDQSHKRGES